MIEGNRRFYLSGFTVIKPTQEEKRLKKYKGGDWYVRRFIVTGRGQSYFPTGWKGLLYSWFAIITVPLVFIFLYRAEPHNDMTLAKWGIAVGYFLILFVIAEHKTYRRRKGFWHEFTTTRRLYKQKKGIFRKS